MTKQQIKTAVYETLQRVEPQERAAFKRQLLLKALMKAIDGKLSDMALAAINEACDEFFSGVQA